MRRVSKIGESDQCSNFKAQLSGFLYSVRFCDVPVVYIVDSQSESTTAHIPLTDKACMTPGQGSSVIFDCPATCIDVIAVAARCLRP